jgi:hypothetical protein
MRQPLDSDASVQAFQHTFHTYPRAWYEHRVFSSRILMLALALPPFWLLAGLKVLPSVPLSVIGVIVYFTGLALDVFSTARVSNLKPEFDRRGLVFPLYESATTFPPEPALKDILTHWHFWFMVAAVPVIYLVPTGAFAILIARLSATLSNLRQARRLKLALSQIDAAGPRSTVSTGGSQPLL